jgi:hypothetical protein
MKGFFCFVIIVVSLFLFIPEYYIFIHPPQNVPIKKKFQIVFLFFLLHEVVSYAVKVDTLQIQHV